VLLLCLLAPLPAARAAVGLAGYVEGRGFDKALLLANTGNRAVDLKAAGWRLGIYFNGATHPRRFIRLRGVIPAHGHAWLVNTRAQARLRGVAAQLSKALNFNGNDAVVLYRGHRVADSLGRVGENPGLAWQAHGVSTRNAVLRRRAGAVGGDTDPRDAFDPSAQWRATSLRALLRLTKAPSAGKSPAARPAGIADIQGAGLASPLEGREADRVAGVVTAVGDDGFFMQAVPGDGDPATSDGIFVYTRRHPSVAAGTRVTVSGQVYEYRDRPADLTLTELHAHQVQARGRAALPSAVAIGRGGRAPPTTHIYRGGTGRAIDAAMDARAPEPTGIAFFERLEGMRVRIEDPQVVGPGRRPGRFWVVADGGRDATGMNREGGITVRRTAHGLDRNPERILIDCRWLHGAWPRPRLGQRLGSVTGVLGYHDGAYVVHATAMDAHNASGRPPARPVRDVAGLRIATYNLDNLDPGDGAARFARLGRQIAVALGGPDLLAVQEIQDNDGARDDGVTRADKTFQALIDAVAAAGGPRYRVASVAPRNDADGGEPGGNIRVGFLYNPDRLQLGVGDAGTAEQATHPRGRGTGLRLSPNPGRIAPEAGAFTHSRKPLAVLFRMGGRRLLAIDVHLTSRSGGDPDWGRFQPPRLGGAQQRREQVAAIRRFLDAVHGRAPHLPVLVLGDFNAQAFEAALGPLHAAGLRDLLDGLAAVQRFSYIYRGNGEALDHVFASAGLVHGARVRIVHVNRGRGRAGSDHDPVWAALPLPAMLH